MKVVLFCASVLILSAFGQKVDFGCLATKCFGVMATCIVDRSAGGCGEMLNCLRFAQDARKQIECTLSYAPYSLKAQDFLGCINEHNCVSASDNGERCTLVPGAEDFQLENFIGNWRVEMGYSRAYDCWDEQTMVFSRFNDTLLSNVYSMKVGKGIVDIPCKVKVEDPENNGNILLDYKYGSMFQGRDHWRILAQTNDHILIYYCGGSAQAGEYTGGVVLSRLGAKKLTFEVKELFNVALRKSGLTITLNDFCSPQHSSQSVPLIMQNLIDYEIY
jgi:hypothetical protein